ncbi:MAG TPA: hypothetical protein DCE42_26235 [Myxococcales bacterium]|nr:hypothetical protein [Deltaproteobacteria bacterium]HAA58289.1 hypothetical protein [Myxococcales bacterium]
MKFQNHASMSSYWEGVLPQLSRELGACKDISTCKALLQAQTWLYEPLRTLSRHQHILSLWGDSRNFDEFAKEQIVEPVIVETVGEVAKRQMTGEVIHAGLFHTYCYLLSLIETPFGMKRDRWVHAGLGELFGLPFDTFSPAPEQGTLLTNISYFLGRISLKNYAKQRATLRSMKPLITRSLYEYPYEELQCWRVVEKVPIDEHEQSVKIVTDLVLPPMAGENPLQLLIYWLEDQTGRPRLITAFLVGWEMVESLLMQQQNVPVEISLRFNACLSSFGTAPRQGIRSITPVFL